MPQPWLPVAGEWRGQSPHSSAKGRSPLHYSIT